MDTDLRAHVTELVEATMADHPDLPGVAVAVDAPDGAWSVARGSANPATGEPLTPQHALKIASCTKPFVACALMVLAHEGRLSLDEPAIRYAPAHIAALFDRCDSAAGLTVRQLLQHRSGLIDHAYTPEFNNAPISTVWTPEAVLTLAFDRPLLFPPGTAFSYSDSAYVLFGQIIEHLTGEELAAAVRRLTHLDALDLPSIHWEVFEPTPAGVPLAHQFYERTDTFDIHPSLDLFGGGGIVASMPDMAGWWTALFDGRVHPHLAEQLADVAGVDGPDGEPFAGGDGIALGIFRDHVGEMEMWGHGGFWGLTTRHIPALHTSVAVAILRRSEAGPTVLSVAQPIFRAIGRAGGLDTGS